MPRARTPLDMARRRSQRRWRPVLCTAAVLGLLAAPATARAQLITGHVLDEATRAPLGDVRIAALDTAGREQASAVTDSAGAFALPLARGRYSLRLERIGYQSLTTDTIGLGSRETITLELRLGVAAIPLEPLVVVGRVRAAVGSEAFYRRLEDYGRSGAGRFYTRAQIDATSTTDVHTLLARDPAVRLLRGRFNDVVIFEARGRKCLPALWVNGVRMRNDPETDLTTLFHPDNIEGVEIYPAEAFVPPELHAEGCGSLAIWTRSPAHGNPFTLRRVLTAAGVAAGLLLLLRL